MVYGDEQEIKTVAKGIMNLLDRLLFLSIRTGIKKSIHQTLSGKLSKQEIQNIPHTGTFYQHDNLKYGAAKYGTAKSTSE